MNRLALVLPRLTGPRTAHSLAQGLPLTPKQVYDTLNKAEARGFVRKLSDDYLEYIPHGRPRVRWAKA